MDENNTILQEEQPEEVNYEVLYNNAANVIKELTAERDSLRNENDKLRTSEQHAIAESAKARELNYTLSRQLNLNQEVEKSIEQQMAEMFLKKGER